VRQDVITTTLLLGVVETFSVNVLRKPGSSPTLCHPSSLPAASSLPSCKVEAVQYSDHDAHETAPLICE